MAFFTNALTADQVQGLYGSLGVAPALSTQPATGRVVNGGSGTFATFAVTAGGSSPLAYQWYFNASSNYSGATRLTDNVVHYANSATAQLTVTNLTGADSGYYFVIVTNSSGSVTSILASLTVNMKPVIISQSPTTYTNLFTLFAGASPTFSVTPSGSQPISYLWFTNGVLDGAVAGSNFTWANVQIGFITNICIVTNAAGSATNVWVASVIAGPPNNAAGLAPYPQAVLALNPIAYWRLNEDNDDYNGDNGYVVFDYAGGNDGLYTNAYLGSEGYSPSTDPSDTSVYFGAFGTPALNNLAGQIQSIDFATANGANAEFTVEAWVNGNTARQVNGGAVITQGKFNVNDAFNLGLDSQSPPHYRFYIRTAAGSVFSAVSSFAPDGNWHHLAGVCDEANSKLLLYIDGALAASSPIPAASGLFEASAPVTIGAGTTDGVNYTNQFQGYLNDVAVYNYALNAGQVAGQVRLSWRPALHFAGAPGQRERQRRRDVGDSGRGGGNAGAGLQVV